MLYSGDCTPFWIQEGLRLKSVKRTERVERTERTKRSAGEQREGPQSEPMHKGAATKES